MSKKFSVRRTDSVDKVIELFFTISPDDDWPGRDNSVYWLMHLDKEPCGLTIATPVDKDTIYAAYSGILPGVRGKGLGRRLIAVREKWARAQGYKHVVTYTLTTNGSSMYNLFKCGYKVYDPAYPYQGNDVVYFIKNL